MRPTRLTTILAAVLAAIILAACGSAAGKVSAPPTTTRPPTLSLAGASEDAKLAPYPQRSVHYVLDGDLADLGADAPVRMLVGHDATEADVARVAGILGLHAAPVRTDWGWEVRDGAALLDVEVDGGSTWLDYSSQGNAGIDGGASVGSVGSGSSEPSTGADGNVATPVPPVDVPPADAVPPDAPPVPEPSGPLPTIPPPVDVPNADDATSIAQSLLDDLGVLGDQQWAHDVSDTTTDVSVACDTGATCPQPEASPVTERTVTYELVLDGARIQGVGWNVTIGSHRTVESLSGTWAEPGPAVTYPLRTTAAVFADLEHGRAQYIGAQPLTANAAAEIAPDDGGPVLPNAPLEAHITGVTLGIARWDGTDGDHAVTYLVPTYRFHAQVAGGSTYDIELLALDPGAFTISRATGAGATGTVEPDVAR